MKNYNSKKEMARVLTLDEASVRLGHNSHGISNPILFEFKKFRNSFIL